MTKPEKNENKEVKRNTSENNKSLALSQAREENRKKLDKLPKLENDLVTLVCLYSLMDAYLMGPILAKLMTEYEKEDFDYYELLSDRILEAEDSHLFSIDSKKKKSPHNMHCQYVLAKRKEMLSYALNGKTIQEMEEEDNALVIHSSPSPITRIPFFDRGNYFNKLEKYRKYPYVLDFLDYVISKKAKSYGYKLNVYPVYTEIELYVCLREYLEINLLKIREKAHIESVVKRLILTKEDGI